MREAHQMTDLMHVNHHIVPDRISLRRIDDIDRVRADGHIAPIQADQSPSESGRLTVVIEHVLVVPDSHIHLIESADVHCVVLIQLINGGNHVNASAKTSLLTGRLISHLRANPRDVVSDR